MFLLTSKCIIDQTCDNSTIGNLLKISNGSSTGVFYSVIYNSSRIDPTLLFIADMAQNDDLFLDSVSVVNATDSSVQLLSNSGFDKLLGGLDGWGQGCENGIGALENQTCQHRTCVKLHINNSGSKKNYGLFQTFTATIGQLYNISFWLLSNSANMKGESTLYVNIV